MVHNVLLFLDQKNPFKNFAKPLTMVSAVHSCKKKSIWENGTRFRMFSTTELRFFTKLERSAIIYALLEYEFLIQGSQYPIILYTDHKPILFLFTKKNKPNHSLQILSHSNKVSKLTHSLEGRQNLSLPDL